MANDENKIILEFPATNVEIEFGETITFDNISGFLNSNRVTYNGESLTEEITHLEDGKADKETTYTKNEVDNALNNKMDKENPTGTGSFSLNRKAFTTVGNRSVTVGDNNEASGNNSFAEGQSTKASGLASHAEGCHTVASNSRTHAEGYSTQANGMQSHAEGYSTQANGTQSHAEGYYSEASGASSHAEGTRTIANHKSQHVFGEFNIPDDSTATADNKGNYVEIVGNGTSSNARSNARTLDWQGNEVLAGNLTFNGNKSLTSEISRLDGRIDNLPADTNTWRAIKVNGVEKLGNDTSSGSLDIVDTDNIEAEFDNDGNKLKLKTKNIYTKTEVDSIVSDAIYNVLPDDTASGSVANFNTSLELPIKSLVVDVNAVQEAGTPTPSTPKAISGWSAITLDANGTTEVINLGSTYYGGHFTQDKDGHRQFEVTHGYITLDGTQDISVANWRPFSNTIGWVYPYNLTNNKIVNNNEFPNMKCEELPVCKYGSLYTLDIIGIGVDSSIYGLVVRVAEPTLTTKSAINAYLTNNPIHACYELATPIIIDLPDGEPIVTLNGTNNIYADTGDTSVVFKSSVNDYVSAHSGGNLLGMGGVYLGGAKSGGGEEETDEGEDTEKAKEIDEPKEENKTIGDTKKLGGE